MPFGNRKKNILENLFSSVLSQLKKYHPSGNVKFNNSSIFQNVKLRILMEKILPISLELNFTTNTLGCDGFNKQINRLLCQLITAPKTPVVDLPR